MKWGKWSEKALNFIKTEINYHKRVVIIHGSVRSGKTIAMLVKILSYIKAMGDKGLILIVGVTKDTIYDNILTDLFDTVGSTNYKYNRSNGELTLFNKYKLKIIGAKDNGSEKYLRGKTLAGAYIDELSLIPLNFFKQLLNRCSIENAKIFATTNPDSPNHWLYKGYIDNNDMDEIVESWHFNLDDNLNISEEYKCFIRKAYAGVYYQRYIEGLWVVAEGLVLEEFNKNIHVAPANTVHDLINKGKFLQYWGGVDWGTSSPMSLGVYGITCSGDIYKIREFYKKGKVTSDAIRFFKDAEKELARKLSFIYCDHEPDRLLEMNYASLNAVNACKSVEAGVSTLKTILKNNKLFISEACIYTIDEFLTLRFAEESENKKHNEKAFIGNDHAFDETRYAIHSYKVNYGF